MFKFLVILFIINPMSFNKKPALCEVNLNFNEEPGDASFFNVLIKFFRKMTFSTDTLFHYRKQVINTMRHRVAETIFRVFRSTHSRIKSSIPFPFLMMIYCNFM